MEGALWQGAALGGILFWIVLASYLNVTQKLRSFLQPWVSHHVETGIPIVLQIQSYQLRFLDAFFCLSSCVVSVPFYTAFLPLLFWSGHGKLARQMTLLMASSDYIGNCIKDVVSAPRPRSPPVRRITATKDEEDNALEYGLPSSHTLNTVCLSGYVFSSLAFYSSLRHLAWVLAIFIWHRSRWDYGVRPLRYLLHYVLIHNQIQDANVSFFGVFLACTFVALIGLGRIYLGMHSLVDVLGGLLLGLGVLSLWLTVDEHIDNFVVSGQNVTSFWAALCFILLFAYPTPELPTPSFEYHTAFDGVALGIVAGVQQTYHQFHHDLVPRVFSPQLTMLAFLGRMLVGIPTILVVKFCSKALAKWTLPVVSNTLGIPIKSTSYIPALNGSINGKKMDKLKQGGYLQKFLPQKHEAFDVDTGIRFLQYAGLAWSVVDLVPSLFSCLRL